MKKKHIILLGVTSLIALAATTFYMIKRKEEWAEDAPPPNAPQLDIQNPGDQSDFPAAATGDKDLG